jgi:hypothetical protein
MRLAGLGILVIFLASYGIGQAQSSKQVVERFLKVDTQGIRLTSAGWREADALFTKESTAPPRLEIVVVTNGYRITERTHGPDTAKFYVGYETLGKLNDRLRFVPEESRVQVRTFQEYTVVRGSKRWRLDPSDQMLKEITTSLTWRIEGVQPANAFLAVGGVLQYLKFQSQRSGKLSLRTNSKRSIPELKKYNKTN